MSAKIFLTICLGFLLIDLGTSLICNKCESNENGLCWVNMGSEQEKCTLSTSVCCTKVRPISGPRGPFNVKRGCYDSLLDCAALNYVEDYSCTTDLCNKKSIYLCKGFPSLYPCPTIH